MREVEKDSNYSIKKYNLGYSNFTFELWILLHKSPMRNSYNQRSDYLVPINKVI
jgi:hypothetical protein